jgi:ABC-2 type transport system ATP-binding protein
MITVQNLTKRYGAKTAVDDISFEVRSGAVTGFLGPNGAGKSTTMRMIVGLDRPDAGAATIGGRPYRELKAPLTEVGVLLDAKAVHPGRSARAHLRALAATHGIPHSRVQAVIDLTGLGAVADRRVGGFSLGMGQRLGIAAALLGDPHTLILDEPVNGLDPEGVLWVRQLVRALAAEGRTVFLSSHLMSEMAQTADDVIVLGRGRVLAHTPIGELVDGASRQTVRVRVTVPTPPPGAAGASPGGSGRVGPVATLSPLLQAEGATVAALEHDLAEVTGLAPARIAELVVGAGIPLHELTPQRASLEEAYMALTVDAVEYRTETTR